MTDLWTFPRLIAHRGGGRLAPENTLAGMRTAITEKFAAVEFDVKLTADGKLILLHDDTLDRTTNGHGSALEKSYAELALLDAGSWFSEAFANEPIPSYEAVADYCRSVGLYANVEIKPNPGQEVETGIAVAECTSTLWGSDSNRVMLSSFSEVSLAAARDSAPNLSRALLVEHIPLDWKARLKNLECASLNCNYRNLSIAMVSEIHQAGYRVLCYTVNDLAVARNLFANGVDALFTDCLDTITSSSLG